MNKRLTHATRTSLLHVKRKWSAVITTILWPFCYKASEEGHNRLGLNAGRLSPMEVLLGYNQGQELDCLNETIDLGLEYMSPQYYIIFDDELTTVLYLQSVEDSPKWKYLVDNHTEHAAEESFNTVSLWYEGD
eukprot:5290359-Ditylum_brightwellii.AAC.1